MRKIFYFLFLVYLLLPTPEIPPLPDSFKSTEPGDTIEIPGVSAYYTNMEREEVIDFYKKKFGRFTLRLNHPPEYARETIRETIHSDFFEEILHPWRESLFINGWTPKKDIEYQRGEKKPILEFDRGGKMYQTKITLYLIDSSIVARLVIFHLTLLTAFTIIYFLKKIVLSR